MTIKTILNLLMTSALTLLAMHLSALPDDRYQAISIEADNALLDEKKGLTRYKGNVILRQGTLLVKAKEITVMQNKSTQAADKMTATGSAASPAYFEQQVQTGGEIVKAKAERISYAATTQEIELSGNAELRQGASVISSDSIIYSAESQLFQAKQSTNANGTNRRVQVSLPAPKPKSPAAQNKP